MAPSMKGSTLGGGASWIARCFHWIPSVLFSDGANVAGAGVVHLGEHREDQLVLIALGTVGVVPLLGYWASAADEEHAPTAFGLNPLKRVLRNGLLPSANGDSYPFCFLHLRAPAAPRPNSLTPSQGTPGQSWHRPWQPDHSTVPFKGQQKQKRILSTH